MKFTDDRIEAAKEYLGLYFPDSSEDISVKAPRAGYFDYRWHAVQGIGKQFVRIEYDDPNDSQINRNLGSYGCTGRFMTATPLDGRSGALRRPSDPSQVIGFVHASVINAEILQDSVLERIHENAQRELQAFTEQAIGQVAVV